MHFSRLDNDLNVKIGDFGLLLDYNNTRQENYNTEEKRAKLSIRWMARESITESTFTAYSDVVSFLVIAPDLPNLVVMISTYMYTNILSQ